MVGLACPFVRRKSVHLFFCHFSRLAETFSYFPTWQASSLQPSSSFRQLRPLGPAELERGKQVIDQFVFVGMNEMYDTSIRVLLADALRDSHVVEPSDFDKARYGRGLRQGMRRASWPARRT